MPEEQPASFGESTSLFGGASSSSYSTAAGAPAAAAATPAGEFYSGGSLSPVGRQDSFTGVTGRTGGPVALRQAGTHGAQTLA